MKTKIAPENREAEKLIPPAQSDNSGVGINYADAYVKPLQQTMADGRKIACKRRGLKLTLTIGDKKGEGLLRRIENGPDVRVMLRKALEEAARGAGASLAVEEGVIYLDVP